MAARHWGHWRVVSGITDVSSSKSSRHARLLVVFSGAQYARSTNNLHKDIHTRCLLSVCDEGASVELAVDHAGHKPIGPSLLHQSLQRESDGSMPTHLFCSHMEKKTSNKTMEIMPPNMAKMMRR